MAKIRVMLGADTATGNHQLAICASYWISNLQGAKNPWSNRRNKHCGTILSDVCAPTLKQRFLILCTEPPTSTFSSAGQEIEALWQEYEEGKTPEALLVKDFDKVFYDIAGSFADSCVYLGRTDSCSKGHSADNAMTFTYLMLNAAVATAWR